MPAGTEVGYDQITTATIAIVSTTEATPTTVISCAAHTFDGAAVLLTVFIPQLVTPATAANFMVVVLFESTTQLGRMGVFTTVAGQNLYEGNTLLYRFTPTAGSHTYTIGAWVNSTSGTPAINSGAGGVNGTPPSFARFTKV
jgi:hypothetical protein